MIAALFAGLLVGLVHVISGPDHLSAIAPLASVERHRVWAVGLRWGLGHSLGVVIVGLIAGLLAHLALVDPFSAASERLVGVMLLIIGLWGFWRLGRMSAASASTQNADLHQHADGQVHSHALAPPLRLTISPTSTSAPSRRFAPYAIGILHGCAGGSHLVGILLALAFPTLAGVLTYLAGFVAGSV